MATWRCPNCRTVQGDSSRCFLCGRSATSCGTCAHFRQSVVGGLGYCGLDKKRSPLTGDEQRSCWTGAIDQATDGVFAALSDLAEATRPPLPQPRGDVRPISGR